eukprot:TRINITY_DN10465_c0_g2_i2.p1 TRINITY_DN10465_c0_g2~~TRINITY_DN10465_c0_g2_i2.p1  ORF type:complete len:473 (-),score=81.13 TRINITY_DN10465_c0_g2_i2:313-1731(-)
MSPEMLARAGHGPTLDFYSLGALLFEMLTGLPPFYSRNRQEMYRRIISEAIAVPSYISTSAGSLIKGLLKKNPGERLGAKGMEEVKRHPYLSNVNWEELLKKKITPPIKLEVRASNFDPEYTSMRFSLNELGYNDNELRSQSLTENDLEVNKKRVNQPELTLTSSREFKSSIKNENKKQVQMLGKLALQSKMFPGYAFSRDTKAIEKKTSCETEYESNTTPKRTRAQKKPPNPYKQVVLVKAVSLRGENEESNLDLADNEDYAEFNNSVLRSDEKEELGEYDTRKLIKEEVSSVNGNIVKLNDELCGIISERKRSIKAIMPVLEVKKVVRKKPPAIRTQALAAPATKFKYLQANYENCYRRIDKGNGKVPFRRVNNSVTDKYENYTSNVKTSGNCDNKFIVKRRSRVVQRMSEYQTSLIKSASKDLDFTKVDILINGKACYNHSNNKVNNNIQIRISSWCRLRRRTQRRGIS